MVVTSEAAIPQRNELYEPGHGCTEAEAAAVRRVSAKMKRQASKKAVKMWLIDTGCGHDLASRGEVSSLTRWIKSVPNGMVFHTANGPTQSNDVVDIPIDELRETVSPWILESTPSVLSVGSRCMSGGYAFHWLPCMAPYFVTPSGNIVTCVVVGDIPYLRWR
jgi:hypothetical protein